MFNLGGGGGGVGVSRRRRRRQRERELKNLVPAQRTLYFLLLLFGFIDPYPN
jgi:hypothetical protein